MLEIYKVSENKKRYLDLLLLADEEERMIDTYLERGDMFLLDDGGVKGVCVVTDEGEGVLEIKNIAVLASCQGCGYGKAMIDFIINRYKDNYIFLQVGTGDSPLTVPFYEKCGFVRSHVKKNFFTENYDRPIFECGIQLADMVYLKMKLQ